jgi:hypothetical protein
MGVIAGGKRTVSAPDRPAQLQIGPGGLDRPLDEFTAAAIRSYLEFRDLCRSDIELRGLSCD